MTASQPSGRLAHTTYVRARACLLGLLLCACSGAKEQRPNVVLVTLDTTRPDYFSC
jgi:hypothetical protein